MNYDINLNGLGKLYYPVVWLWKLLYSTITPRFWGGVVSIAGSEIPIVLRIIIIIIVSVIILCIYLSVWAVITGVIIVLTIFTSIIYAFAAIVNVIGGWWKFWHVEFRQTFFLAH